MFITKLSASTYTLSCCVIFLFQFKRFGTDVDKNARDPHGDGDQRRLKGAEGIMVTHCMFITRIIHGGCGWVVIVYWCSLWGFTRDMRAQYHRTIWAGGEISSLLLNCKIPPDSFAMRCLQADAAACAAQACFAIVFRNLKRF